MFGRKLSSNNSWAQQLQHPDPPPLVLIEDRVHGGGHVTRGRRPILLDLLHTELRCPWPAGTGLCEVTPRRGSSLRHERARHGPWAQARPAPRARRPHRPNAAGWCRASRVHRSGTNLPSPTDAPRGTMCSDHDGPITVPSRHEPKTSRSRRLKWGRTSARIGVRTGPAVRRSRAYSSGVATLTMRGNENVNS